VKHTAVAMFVLFLASAGTARADVVALDITPDDFTVNIGPAFTVGYSFTANAAVTVTQLGNDFFVGTNPSPATVSLWDASGGLLGQVSVSSAGNTLGSANFNFTALGTPVTLTAGDTYVIGADEADGNHFWAKVTSITTDPGITYGSALSIGGDNTFPGGHDALGIGGNSYFGPSFALSEPTQVPEPGSLALLGLTAAGAGLYRWRRRKTASESVAALS
jgi:Domain of unknown function (DUF4082)/PEP-CTERM motif